MPTQRRRSADAERLPWTGEFTPQQLRLRGRSDDPLGDALQTVAAHAGDREAIVQAIRARWFFDAAANRADPEKRLTQQRVRSGNVLNGMQSYGLVDDNYDLTELGQRLLGVSDTSERDNEFAAFLLKHRRGFELLNVVRDLQSRGERVTNDTLRGAFRRLGWTVAHNNADMGKLRQWLEPSGVVNRRWQVDDAQLARLTNTSVETIREWDAMTRAQRAFLQTLRRLGETRGTAAIPSPELLDFVWDEHGSVFNEGQVARDYRALADTGWILHDAPSGGRGGKGGSISATDKLLAVDFEVLTGFSAGQLPADLRAVMTTPLAQIHADLSSSDTHVKGIALELLAVNLATDLGLLPARLRLRHFKTGGAEVDLVAEGAHLLFSRWLFQCKNTRRVNVEVLAKEVGMATLLQAHVIVIATTGSFSAVVETYAERVGRTTPFQVVLVNGEALQRYREDGALALRDGFRQGAAATLRLKRDQVDATLDRIAEDES